MDLLLDATALLSSSRFGLLILDSLISLFRTEFGGRAELAERQMHLGKLLKMLRRLADSFGVAICVTNQVMAKPDAMPYGPDKVPTGGHVVAHATQTRLFLRKGKGETRICKIYGSPLLPEVEAQFKISEGGITDCPDEKI